MTNIAFTNDLITLRGSSIRVVVVGTFDLMEYPLYNFILSSFIGRAYRIKTSGSTEASAYSG